MTTTWDVVGNQSTLETLRKAVASGQPSHAYLFTGPEHVGKTTTARRFSAALLCSKENAPCPPAGASAQAGGTCANCALWESGNHPDYLEVGSDEEAKTIPIDEVRELTRQLSLKPHSSRFRVAVIPDAERLGLPAQNALLKVLEEPPEYAVLILTATTPSRLLPTTVSRCQQVRFSLPDADTVADALKGLTNSDTARHAAAASGRRPGLAVRLAEDPEALTARAEWGKRLEQARTATIPEKLALAKTLSADERLPQILDEWITLTRMSLGPAEKTEPKTVTSLRNAVGQEALGDQLSRLFAARRRLRYNPNVQLLVEQMLLRLT